MDTTQQLTEIFQQQFGYAPTNHFFAPGRINLIGEHTDYNGGYVFPCAITIGTYAAVAKNGTKNMRLFSQNFPEQGILSFSVEDGTYNKEHGWANYAKGVIKFLRETGRAIEEGLDIAIEGNIPNASGLSSSASLEILMGTILNSMFQLGVEKLDLIKTGKRVENEFIGVNSGIMDQFAVTMGEKDQALLLDTNTLEYEKVPVELGDHVIVIMNTKKRRELADSKYNERRSECEQALAELQQVVQIKTLADLDEAAFNEHSHVISSPILVKRARHAVTENQRTLQAVADLKAGRLEQFGKLMNASHISLRDDYEVTGKELDTLVEAAWKQPGVLGARMTGAGFGGCAIAIVQKDQADAFIEAVGKEYEASIGYPGEFLIAEVGDGAKEL